jgi:hypothetical protein
MIALSTTWCRRHGQLETIDSVVLIRADTVPSPHEGTTIACEVTAHTTEGCKVHFIGGPEWSLVARAS